MLQSLDFRYVFSVGLFISLACVGQAAAIPADDPHQTIADNAFSKHDALLEMKQFNRETLVEAYEQFGVRDESWGKEAIELLEMYAVVFTYNGSQQEIYIRKPVLEARAKFRSIDELSLLLRDKKCKDPLILYLLGAHIEWRGGDIESIHHYIASYDAFKESDYPAYRQFNCLNRLLRSTDSGLKRTPELIAMRAQWLEAYKETAIKALRDTTDLPSFTLRDRVVGTIYDNIDGYLDRMEPDEQAENLKDVIRLLEPLKDDHEWVYYATRGLFYVDLAWVYRGGGFANTVRPEQWQNFETYLKEAKNNLKTAWAIEPTSLIANEMIKIAMAGHADEGDSERVWFDRAVEIMFDDSDAWDNIINASRPQWGGSYDRMYELALECVNTGRFDTALPYWGARLLMIIEAESGREDYWRKPEAIDAMDRLARGMEACELRSHEQKPWFTLLRAAFMWKGRDYERASQALDEAGPLDEKATDIAILAFARVTGDFHDAVGEIHAMTSPRKNDVSAVLAELSNGEIEQAEARLERLLEHDDWHPGAREFLQTKLNGIAFQRAFQSGEWVRLDGRADALTNWRPTSGNWEVDDQGRLVGTAATRGLMLLYKHQIAGPYELVCDAELIGSKKKSNWANMGLIGRYQADADMYGFWIFPNDMRAAGEWHGWHDGGARGFVKPGINKITIRHNAKRQVAISINGEMYQQFECSHIGANQSFGLSSQKRSMGRGRGVPKDFDELQIRYSNVQIRSLPEH